MLSDAMSRGTIERWALERRIRPQADGLEWLGYIKPEIVDILCPWCDEVHPHQGVVRVEGLTLYMCPGCGSHQYSPKREPSPVDEMTPFAVRNYVEYGAGLQPFCEYVSTLTGGRQGGSLLDVGCGFGFAVDIARRQKGWRALGVDPGALARTGSKALGVTIRQAAIGAGDTLGDSQFDAILCAEVLAHAADPAALLEAMARHLAPRGAMLIATVTPNALYESENIGVIREVLSPSQHTFIPSALGLATLIERL
jgi:2-polyprenyl-3-methyl-5-hydroxy-6-metoxy-1,4-benzoquinol methylase